MPIAKRVFKNKQDVADYLAFLDKQGLAYHYDDDVRDIAFSKPLSEQDHAQLIANHDAMVRFCHEAQCDLWSLLPE